jgi:Raf kinase inhibitor-like YbhB/YbcL family protein
MKLIRGFWHAALLLAFLLVVGSVCSGKTNVNTNHTTDPSTQSSSTSVTTDVSSAPLFELRSVAFESETSIPKRFSCKGDDISPPLHWNHAPEGVASYALICEDPDAPRGTWVHWVLYNIPADINELAEAQPAIPVLPNGSIHGKNSWDNRNYGGPCPPSGTHRYYFRLFALDTLLEEAPRMDAEALRAEMENHILASAELMGKFSH